jgi:TonB family protein
VAISFGLHAAFLMAVKAGPSHEDGIQASATGVEVRLMPSGARVQSDVEAVPAEWQPLERIPTRTRVNRPYPAMIEFHPVDLPPRAFDEKHYLPLVMVTRPPAPIRPVAVPYPQGAGMEGRVTARLTLFIDEDGSVARVVVANADLPEAFARAATDAFAPAKFRPGQLENAPVKVRMVVDVEFEDRGEMRAKRRG